jgi:hypothetical protein
MWMKAQLVESQSFKFVGIAVGNWLGLVAVVAVLVFAGSASAQPAGFASTDFCAPGQMVRDFGIARLPPVREVPKSAKRLGYGAVTMYEVSPRVTTEPVPFGYGFLRQYNYTNAAVPLNWTVTARLWTIDGQGRKFREVDQARLFIGRLNADDRPVIEVEPPKSRRGFYRFDMQIRNQADKTLGSFSTYLKVVRPSFRPLLRLDQERIQPGQELLIRLENHGGSAIFFENLFSVQRFENGRWTRVLRVPRVVPKRIRIWPPRLRLLGPGASRCDSLSLPINSPAGLYRISKSVRTEPFPEGEVFPLTAPFEVVGSPTGVEYR